MLSACLTCSHGVSSPGLTGPDDDVFVDQAERVSAMRHPGEDDLAFFERRYQERVLADN